MKAILTTITFAFALMVFAFNANPAFAHAQTDDCPGYKAWGLECYFSQIDEVDDPSQEGNERDVADSGEEGSTSAASEGGINAIRVSDDTSDKIGKDDTGSEGIITSDH
ncbi:MAG: hypothetical protein OXF09_02020 [Hyphomicrobiales bacterium]|nr:hypothetical protein [Hyphomicrobiales bacterium]